MYQLLAPRNTVPNLNEECLILNVPKFKKYISKFKKDIPLLSARTENFQIL